MFFNTTHKKHRKLRRLLWPRGEPEVTPRWARAGRRQGRLATITFGYQPKASGKDTGPGALGPAPGFKGYRPCRRPLECIMEYPTFPQFELHLSMALQLFSGFVTSATPFEKPRRRRDQRDVCIKMWQPEGPSTLTAWMVFFCRARVKWNESEGGIKHQSIFSRKRPRRVPSKKALSLKTVFKDCHQTSPKVLLKWWLSLKIVIKHRPKFYWSDGCL